MKSFLSAACPFVLTMQVQPHAPHSHSYLIEAHGGVNITKPVQTPSSTPHPKESHQPSRGVGQKRRRLIGRTGREWSHPPSYKVEIAHKLRRGSTPHAGCVKYDMPAAANTGGVDASVHAGESRELLLSFDLVKRRERASNDAAETYATSNGASTASVVKLS